ncbi:hypothetical protein [Shinella sp.]|uniref:hypothetical protein n=1 Tax=Shinella sp. TaxID=1870904 RepID=UPI0029B211C0|nr:hypothetical protein [Shinella sp.]MDX3975799.1 hypothetical protein [Shinella sp.]
MMDVSRNKLLFLAVSKGDRTSIAAAVECLIGLLDVLEGDCDMESGGDDEASLGWPLNGPQALRLGFSAPDECEDENEHGGDILDEPHDQQDEDDEDGGDREADPAECGIADVDALWQLGLDAEMTQVAL